MHRDDWKATLLDVIRDWNGKYVVSSPDVDGLLCAALLCETHGARMAGIYTTRDLLAFDGAGNEDLKDALWVDHDISEPGIRCIGQHLVLHSPNDRLPRRHSVSFNPNIFFRQALPQSFQGRQGRRRDKYPFATVHFLMASLGLDLPPRGSEAYALLAHPDGSWANAVDYPVNCKIWNELMFQEFPLIGDLTSSYCKQSENFSSHARVVRELSDIGIYSKSSAASRATDVDVSWQALCGYQAIRYQRNWNPMSFFSKVNSLIAYISTTTGWKISSPTSITNTLEGVVVQQYPESIRQGEFDDFMLTEEIFSHAITFVTTLRYTKGINLSSA